MILRCGNSVSNLIGGKGRSKQCGSTGAAGNNSLYETNWNFGKIYHLIPYANLIKNNPEFVIHYQTWTWLLYFILFSFTFQPGHHNSLRQLLWARGEQTLRVVTARDLLRPQWFFDIPSEVRIWRMERWGLRFNVLVWEDVKVWSFAGVIAKAALLSQLFSDPEYWSGRDLNPRPPAQETDTLPLSHRVAVTTLYHTAW